MLILDVISKIVKSKLSSNSSYSNANNNNDVLWLLSTIKDIMLSFEEVKPVILATDDQMRHNAFKIGRDNNQQRFY